MGNFMFKQKENTQIEYQEVYDHFDILKKLPKNTKIIKSYNGEKMDTSPILIEYNNKNMLYFGIDCKRNNVKDFYMYNDNLIYLSNSNYFYICKYLKSGRVVYSQINIVDMKIDEFVYIGDMLYALSNFIVYEMTGHLGYYSDHKIIDTNVKQITANSYLLMVLKHDGNVFIHSHIGSTTYDIKQLDLQNIKQISCSQYGIMCRDKNNEIYLYCNRRIDRGFMQNIKEYMRYKILKIDFEFPVIDIHAIDKYMYVLSNKNELYCCDNIFQFANNRSYKKITCNVNRLYKLRLNNWSPEEHYEFPIYFKKVIYEFLKCLKRMQNKANVHIHNNPWKIPKFVLHGIIKDSI